jgi:hypothetical protein
MRPVASPAVVFVAYPFEAPKQLERSIDRTPEKATVIIVTRWFILNITFEATKRR